jgi:hypothetical protein
MSAAEHIGPRVENVPYPLSRLSAAVFVALFLIGVAVGGVQYARRSPVIGRHIAGSNAITIHVVLAIAAAAAVTGIQARRARRPAQRGRSPWAAPFSASALARLGRTIRFAGGLSLPTLARIIAAVPLVLAILYQPFRMGAQLTGGLDPNATVNAWGGPTYAGALLAHWLDCLTGFYFAAFLLGRLLLPAAAGHR